MQFCTTERPQLFEFEVATCRTCMLRSKKAILEVATSNLQKWRDFAQSWCPCMLIWHPLTSTLPQLTIEETADVFKSNTGCSRMVRVRQQSNFFREDRRLQRVIGDCISVIISRKNLQKIKSTFIIQSFNELMGSSNQTMNSESKYYFSEYSLWFLFRLAYKEKNLF